MKIQLQNGANLFSTPKLIEKLYADNQMIDEFDIHNLTIKNIICEHLIKFKTLKMLENDDFLKIWRVKNMLQSKRMQNFEEACKIEVKVYMPSQFFKRG